MSIEILTRTILEKMTGIGKVEGEFFVSLVLQWLRLGGGYTFENLCRQGFLSAFSYQTHFSKAFHFKSFNSLLIYRHCGLERLWVFDPTHISKAGKHPYGVGYFCGAARRSGCAQAVKRGLERWALSLVDVVNHSAFHYIATQTVLVEKQTLLGFYSPVIVQQATQLLLHSKYLAVDAYFAKHEFIDSVSKTGLQVITRLGQDAALWYPYLGAKRAGRGRPQQFAGKVAVKNLDYQYFPCCIQEADWRAYQACLYSKRLKRWLQVVIVHTYQSDGQIKSSRILACTDTSLSGIDLYYYYHLRFQAELLYGDAKQLLGLTHCQSRQQNRLAFHFNFSLTLLSLAKVAHYLTKPLAQPGSFSLQDIKTSYCNQHRLDLFIEGFGLCPIEAKQ